MEEKGENGIIRDELGRIMPGSPGGPGRPPDTVEKKLEKKIIKELVEEYKETLASYLPLIAPVLGSKALEGDVPAIKEVHDRIMGKAEQKSDITSGGKPLYLPPELLNKNQLDDTSSSSEQNSE